MDRPLKSEPIIVEAEAEAAEAQRLVDVLREKVAGGDPHVTPAQLAEQRSLAEFAGLRVKAATKRAEKARHAARVEKGREIACEVQRRAESVEEGLSEAWLDLVDAVRRVTQIAHDRRAFIRESGTEVAALHDVVAPCGVRGDHSMIHGRTAAGKDFQLRATHAYQLIGAAVELGSDHDTASNLLRDPYHLANVLGAVPALAEALDPTPTQLSSIQHPTGYGRGDRLAELRDKVARTGRDA